MIHSRGRDTGGLIYGGKRRVLNSKCAAGGPLIAITQIETDNESGGLENAVST